MKISIKKEFDGILYAGSCENVPSCYVQAKNPETITKFMKHALELYKKNCEQRYQTMPNEPEKPILDIKIKFSTLSTNQLIIILKRQNYHVEYSDNISVLLLNSNFPFNRIHLPQTDQLSPIIVKKIFSEQNTTYVPVKRMHLNRSVS